MGMGQKPGTKLHMYDTAWVTADSGEESLQQYTFIPASKSWAVNFPDKAAVPLFHSLYQISLFGKSRNKGSFKTQVEMRCLFPQEVSYCLL